MKKDDGVRNHFSKKTGIRKIILPDGSLKREMQFELGGSFYPIVEANKDFPITVSKKDVDKAIPADPNHCALAEAARSNVAQGAFFKRVAYLLFFLPDEKGKINGVARRYTYSNSAAYSVKKFDEGDGFKSGTYILKAPPQKATLEGRRIYQQKKPIRKNSISSPKTKRTYAGRSLHPERLA